MKKCLQDRGLQWFGHVERRKKMLGLVIAEPSKLGILSPEVYIGKHGMR